MENDKVLLTSSRYLPNIGGIENSLYYLSEAFSELGFEVYVVASNILESGAVSLPACEVHKKNLKVLRYNYYLRGRPSALLNYINGFFEYKKLRKSGGFKIVVCRNHVTVLLCWLAGFRNIYYILPGTQKAQNDPGKYGADLSKIKRLYREMAYAYHQILQMLAVRLSKRNYVFSCGLERQVREFLGYKGPVFKVKPGVDSRKFSLASLTEKTTLRQSLEVSQTDVVLLGLGRFVEAKRFDILIESLNFLPDRYKVVLVGAGALENKYDEIIKRNNLQARARIFGATDCPQDFYKLADVFVMTSTSETLGQTILEAQCSGLPVVAFSPSVLGVDTATNEVVDSKTSVIVDCFSSEALARGIIEASENLSSGVFEAHEIRNHAVANFSWRVMAEELQK